MPGHWGGSSGGGGPAGGASSGGNYGGGGGGPPRVLNPPPVIPKGRRTTTGGITGIKNRNILNWLRNNRRKISLFSGPEFDKYTKQMSDFYSNSPSKFSYDVNVNKAAQDFLTDKIRNTAGPILPGGIPTDLATAAINFANIPGSMPMSLAHDAVQSKQRVENQFIGASPSIMAKGPSAMDYVSGFMNEQPFRTAASRAIGIASAFPGVEPAGKWLGEKAYNLMNPSKALASGGLVNLYRHGGFSG